MSEAPSSSPAPALLLGRRPDSAPPRRVARLWSVVHRHWVIYVSTLLANALPAFMEPTLLLLAIGLGLGSYLDAGMAGLPMAAYMGPGALAMTAMYTSSFETTYGTFVRLVYQKTYDGMLATPLTPGDVFAGELVWCGLKGFGFSAVVLAVFVAFGWFQGWWESFKITCLLIPLVGFAGGLAFGGLGFQVASRTKNMNNFSFYFTGVLSPMAFFSGMVFPVADLPMGLRHVAYALPLFHVTELNRLLLFGPEHCVDFVPWCAPYLVLVAGLASWLGVRAMTMRVIR
jgi:lipooligosaccharide transport system permease protein